jgi:hypothetical protein
MSKEEKIEFYHPCQVIRGILERAVETMGDTFPEKIRPGMMSTLQSLLLYMNISGISKEIPRSDLQASGRASLSQLDLSGYSVSRLKVKLREWRRLGIVDWSPRSDNKGNDYIVYATPNPDIIKKAEPSLKKREQALRAAAARWRKSVDKGESFDIGEAVLHDEEPEDLDRERVSLAEKARNTYGCHRPRNVNEDHRRRIAAVHGHSSVDESYEILNED